ncbi:hypothetical protein SSEA_SKINNY_92 [Mycobacterium phage Skinny]|uniref:Uncharacterized protein n=6 Tax=Bongovirus bongo TaxID=1983750 RepID=A0A0M3UKL4_9CAUD|nr:hypothetical protein PEGLEG_87 [Mycobacterium phage PegLeg]YP_009604946.1 hypothetical protein FDH95_gp088 [Mycobacterium phage Bongo]ALF00615.1 hypothetical protein SEA_BRICOLE_87 [Mycobacterium phage Bricole]AXQ52728.1 hypothetical protein SEA_IPHANE7_87 [Mycobacterium phage IPhane7]QDH93662.1 hypothetical protein SEA_LILHOMIEP_88 [Mycobacterium phage LilhomieP]QGJ93233.1 hypothetical protein SEA_TYDAWG_88 [Mycobacterium phage TyDawg]UXE05284.1 hypothetical protein SSEA_SKINNY_92 [Mycoba
MATKKQRARQKYRDRYGRDPQSDAQLATFMATLPTSAFIGCSDFSSSSSFDSGSSFDGGSCSF